MSASETQKPAGVRIPCGGADRAGLPAAPRCGCTICAAGDPPVDSEARPVSSGSDPPSAVAREGRGSSAPSTVVFAVPNASNPSRSSLSPSFSISPFLSLCLSRCSQRDHPQPASAPRSPAHATKLRPPLTGPCHGLLCHTHTHYHTHTRTHTLSHTYTHTHTRSRSCVCVIMCHGLPRDGPAAAPRTARVAAASLSLTVPRAASRGLETLQSFIGSADSTPPSGPTARNISAARWQLEER